jgi:hypothetical protein
MPPSLLMVADRDSDIRPAPRQAAVGLIDVAAWRRMCLIAGCDVCGPAVEQQPGV